MLAAIVEADRRASETLRVFEPLPQRLCNVRFEQGAAPLEAAPVRTAIAAAQAALGGAGRLVIRASVTEPVVRVMAEAETADAVDAAIGAAVEAVRRAAA